MLKQKKCISYLESSTDRKSDNKRWSTEHKLF